MFRPIKFAPRTFGFGTRALAVSAILFCVGCTPSAPRSKGPLVIVLDGAGWSGSASRIKSGLREAGYRGEVRSYPWTTFLGPASDHVLVEHKRRKGRELAEYIQERRRHRPRDPLHVMGLSAGTAVAVFALEELPPGVTVDNVILLAPSISATYDLSDAIAHVRGFLYATSSPSDTILGGVTVAADGTPDPPAGLYGFRIPGRIKSYDAYTRVVNLPWRSVYADLGWNGSHTGATNEEFVASIIAPRLLSSDSRPLNRPLASPWLSQWRRGQSAREGS